MQHTTRLPRGAPLDDKELGALAMAADPDPELPADAVPLDADRDGEAALLPGWYMAAPAGGRLLHGWRRTVVWLVIAALVTITAYGLCNTYGDLGLH